MEFDKLKTPIMSFMPYESQSQTATVDLTPMLDTIFLIILLLLATLMHSTVVGGFPVDVPRLTRAGEVQTEQHPIEVSVDKTGQIYIGTRAIDLTDLGVALTEAAQAAEIGKVLVRGDRQVQYGSVASLLGVISRVLPDTPVVLITGTDPVQ